LAVCFINVKHSHDSKVVFQKEESIQLDPIVADE
jgi:hypothetical protein